VFQLFIIQSMRAPSALFRLPMAISLVLVLSHSLMAQKKADPVKYSFDKKTNEMLARADKYLEEVNYKAALEEYERAYEMAMAKQKKHNAASAELLAKLGNAQYNAGKTKEGLATLREAFELTKKHTKTPDRNYVMVRVYLAEAMRFNGTKKEEAILLEEASVAAQGQIGLRSVEMAMVANGYAELLLDGDDGDTVLNLLLFSFQTCDSLLPPTDRRVIITMTNLAAALMKFGHDEVAMQYVAVAMQRASELPNPRNHLLAYNLMTAAILHSYSGNHGQSVQWVNLAEEIMIESLGHLHPFTTMVQINKGGVLA
jgi:tetratricopeptide (TPR) repeat protein